MDAAEIGQWSLDLRNRIQRSVGFALPTHVTTRLALLVQAQPIEFVDVAAQPAGRADNAAGEIVAFTSELVGVIRFTDIPQYTREYDPPPGDVSVMVAPRRSLVRMTIDKAEGNANYNGAWMSPHPRWPRYGQLRLTYSALLDDVILGRPNMNFSEDAPELDAFLPSLSADLASPLP